MDNSALKTLQEQMALDHVRENCQVLVNFFKNRDLSYLDDLIELTSENRVSTWRSHAIALSIDTDRYLALLKQNPDKYKAFAKDLALFTSNIEYLYDIRLKL